MGTIEMNNKVMELKELEQFAAEIAEEIEAIKDELKAEMTRRGKDELTVGVFKVRWKEYESKRFDSKGFQKDHGDLYEAYKKPTVTKRFTIQ